jgi:hypothetical protein
MSTWKEEGCSTGRSERKGSGDSDFHDLVPENVADSLVVPVQSRVYH